MVRVADDIRVSSMDIWSIYMSINLHFKQGSKYDAFKFNFKGPQLKKGGSSEAKNKWALEKLSRNYNKKNDVILYFLANILEGTTWLGDMNDGVYQDWIARIQRLDYAFKSEMRILSDYCNKHNITFDESIIPEDRTSVPPIYSLYSRKEICLESLVCLENLVGFTKGITRSIKDPLGFIEDISNRIIKYKPFLQSEMNIEKHRDIVINLFTTP